MPRYEYKVVPAPAKGIKAKGVRTPEGRFALSVEQLLNQLGGDGWEYQRAELLPSDERTGLTGSTVNWRNVLVFRRLVEAEADEAQPGLAVEMPSHDPEGRPLAGALPGPDVAPAPEPPAPISETPNDPPLEADAGKTPEFHTARTDASANPPEDAAGEDEQTEDKEKV